MRKICRPSLPGHAPRRTALFAGTALVAGTVSAVVFGAGPAAAGTAVKTFTAGASGTWTVPQGVSEVQVSALGGAGGYGNGGGGGAGELITTSLDVTAGTEYYVHVGADNGGNGAGGGGPYSNGNGSNGGGASDLRTGSDDLAGRILVAAGGGGGGNYAPGGNAGQAGAGYYDSAAQPGSSSAGGSAEDSGGGYRGGDGGLGQGGGGGCCGGGGGGGYYGGGGGEFGGGAGGSSYVATGAGLHDTTVGLGDRSQPSVVITYIAPTAVDASLSDLTLPADGTSQGTLTLTVDDTYGQGVPGDDIAFTAADPNVQFGSVAGGQDGTYTVPVTASSTAGAVAITATDTSVNDVVAHGVLVLTSLPQAIGLSPDAPADAIVGGDTYAPQTSGGDSGEPVVLGVDASTTHAACSILNGTVSFDHVGTCVLDADQAGNAQYAPAPTVQRTISVGPATQTVSFTSDAPQDAVVGGADYTPLTSGSASGPAVGLSVDGATSNAACSLTGGIVSFDHVGQCVLDADQDADDDHSAAGQVQQSFSVGQGTQAITFNPVTSPAGVGASQTLSASATSDAEVTFTVDPSTDSGVCSITGQTVTFAGAGSCVVDADQAGTTDYAPAPTQPQQVDVDRNATAVSVQLTTSDLVFGESATATATVTGAQHGTVQFEVSSLPVGDPVTVGDDGTAISPLLTGAVGAHPVSAAFTPTDTTTYAPSTASAQTLTVGQASTTSTLTVTPAGISATVTPVAPGSGTPSGQVTFSVGGLDVGTSPLDGGVATLAYPVPSGRAQQVAAAYSGDADFLASSHSVARHDPTITAQVSSPAGKTRYGWYRGPVEVSFTCVTNGAALAAACPAPVTVSGNGAARSVSRTITATDGGQATINVRDINIDHSAPHVRIVGVRNNARYFAAAPAATCVSRDALSGIASCTLTHRTRGLRETIVATATDQAANRTARSVTVTLMNTAVQGARFAHGVWTVHRGRSYTLLAVAHRRPTYVNAAVAPHRPAGLDGAFRYLGHGRWAHGVYMQRRLRSHAHWNVGIKVGHTVRVLTLHVVG